MDKAEYLLYETVKKLTEQETKQREEINKITDALSSLTALVSDLSNRVKKLEDSK